MRRPNRGSFRKGPDPRRHTFTAAERRRGGCTRWAMTMIEVRSGMGLWIPEHLFDAVAHLKRGKP